MGRMRRLAAEVNSHRLSMEATDRADYTDRAQRRDGADYGSGSATQGPADFLDQDLGVVVGGRHRDDGDVSE